MWQPRDRGVEGGAEQAPLLEGIRSALEEQTWLMRQMWSTHTAMESEIRLLRHGMDYMLERVFWAGEGEQEAERGRAEECGVLEEVREEGETME